MGVSLLPRLLDGSGNEVRRLSPIRESISLKVTPLSYATIELPAGETIATGSWIELFTETGSVGIFRAKTPEDGYGDLSVSVQLEHGIVETSDFLVKHDYEEESTVATALGKIWQNYGGSKWQLGTISQSDGVILRTDFGTNVLEAMLAVLKQTPQYMLSFNFTTSPWTVGVTARDTNVSAEARLSRNVESVKISRDDSELCTRAYLMGLPGSTETVPGHIDADTISTYGVIEREIEQSGDYTEAQATRIANQYIAKHKRPSLSIDISGYDLSALTGETWDSFRIGQKLRLAIPEDSNSPYEETIIGLSYSDIVANPRAVTISMAEEEDSVISFLHKQDTTGGRSGRSGRYNSRKTINNINSTIENYGDSIELHSERLAEDGSILQQAGLYLDPDGVLIYADDLPNELGNKLGGLHSEIQVQANRIGLVVEGTGANAHIKPASIVASINEQTGQSQVLLSADQIDIDGVVTKLESYDIECGDLTAGATNVSSLVCENAVAAENGEFGMLQVDEEYIWVADISISDNVMTITYTDGSTATFSKATTLSGEWGGTSGSPTGVFTVTAMQGQTQVGQVITSVTQGATTWDGNSGTIPIKATIGTSATLYDVKNVTVDGTPRYRAGSASVVLSDTLTWGTTPDTNINANQNSVTVQTSGRVNTSGSSDEKSKTINLYSQVSTSGLTATFYVTHTDSTDAKRIIKREATCSDAYLLPENIKDRVTIFGVTGNYSGSSTTPTLTGNWVSGKLTVSSSPAASSNYVRTLASGTPVWDSYYTSVTIPINVTYGSSGQYSESTGYSVYLNTYNERLAIWNEAYVAGWNAYRSQTWYVPTDSGSNGKFRIPGPATLSGGSMSWSWEDWDRGTNSVVWDHSSAYNYDGSTRPSTYEYIGMTGASSSKPYIYFTINANGASKTFCVYIRV